MRTLILAVAAAACLAWSAPSEAQSTVFVMFNGTCASGTVPCDPPRILQADAEQGRIVAVVPIPCPGRSLRVTADGRFLVWNEVCGGTPGQLRVLNLVNGGQVPLGPAPAMFHAHPSELRLLFPEGETIVSLTPAGRTTIAATGCPAGRFSLSGDGSRLIQTCPSGYVVRTTATGTVVRTIPFTGLDQGAVLDERGTTAYVLRVDPITFRSQQISRVDIATGAESVPRQSTGDPIQGYGALTFDRRTARVAVATSGWVEMFDGVSLAPVVTFLAGITFSPPPAFHPVMSRAYGFNRDIWPTTVWVVDPDRRTTLGLAQVATDGDGIADLVVAPHPPAPSAPLAAVSGREVTVTWAPDPRSPLLTGYEIEVAAGAGGPPLLTLPTTGTSVFASGVLPGTYVVRVRARNHAGVSAPSAEVTVVVP